MQTILITGGTGLIGRALSKMLVEKGYKVIILTRNLKESKDSNIGYAVWDVEKQTIEQKAIATADYIVHLAGAGVADKRWTSSRKNEIRESRIQSSQLLVNALKNTPNQVKAVISSSAIGWYGDDKDRSANKKAFTEDMPANKDFLGETCRLWEESIDPVTSLNKRLVKLRTGIVLSNEGGAFAEFKKPVQFGFAAILGNGQQAISWIHIQDMCRMYLFAIENDEMKGVFNAVAPIPVRNKTLTTLLAKKMKGKFFVSMYVPSFLLKIVLGEMSIEVLKSATVSDHKMKEAGFTFLFPSIESAVDDLLETRNTDPDCPDSYRDRG